MEKRRAYSNVTAANSRKQNRHNNYSVLDRVKYAIYCSGKSDTIEIFGFFTAIAVFSISLVIGLSIMHSGAFVGGIAVILIGVAIFCLVGDIVFNPYEDNEY